MIASRRHLFDLPDDIAYLNCAYMAPLMHPVVEAGVRGVRRKARPWEIAAPDFFSDLARARGLFARDVVLGRHLIERGLSPGPGFAPILERCRDIQDETGWTDPGRILDQALAGD